MYCVFSIFFCHQSFFSIRKRLPNYDQIKLKHTVHISDHFEKRILGNKCGPWLFLKCIPPPLARFQTSKVNTCLIGRNTDIYYLTMFPFKTVIFLLNRFWAQAKKAQRKLEKRGPCKYARFFIGGCWINTNKPKFSICALQTLVW